eukprot:10113956-Alexandrium_andersonii.AAC.1
MRLHLRLPCCRACARSVCALATAAAALGRCTVAFGSCGAPPWVELAAASPRSAPLLWGDGFGA